MRCAFAMTPSVMVVGAAFLLYVLALALPPVLRRAA